MNCSVSEESDDEFSTSCVTNNYAVRRLLFDSAEKESSKPTGVFEDLINLQDKDVPVSF